MTTARRRNIYSPPVFRSFMAFAGSALVGALATDIAYIFSQDFVWADASDWLVSIGAVVGFAALVIAFVELVAIRRTIAPPWRFMLVGFVAWVLSILNALIHTQDSYTSVYPWGLALSVVTTVVIVIAFSFARSRTIPDLVPEERLA